MANYPIPRKGVAYTFFTGLVDQSNTKLLKANPTLASGDFKVSIDGGAFANLSSLPTVTPASGTAVKIALSAAEMNGENIVVTCIDAAGAEWCDQLINIQTGQHDYDSIVCATVSGRTLDIATTGEAGLDFANFNGTIGSATFANGAITNSVFATGAIDATVIAANAIGASEIADGAIDAAAIAAGAITSATFAAGAINAAAIATDAIDADALAADAVTEIWAKTMTELSAVPGVTASVLSALTWLFEMHRNKRTSTSSQEIVYKDDATTVLSTSSHSDNGTTFSRGEWF